jgi:hypothetical protein
MVSQYVSFAGEGQGAWRLVGSWLGCWSPVTGGSRLLPVDGGLEKRSQNRPLPSNSFVFMEFEEDGRLFAFSERDAAGRG